MKIEQTCRLAGTGGGDCVYGAVRDVTSNDANGRRAATLCLRQTALTADRCFGAIGTILGGLATTREGRRALCDGVTPRAHREACFAGAGAL